VETKQEAINLFANNMERLRTAAISMCEWWCRETLLSKGFPC